MSRLCYTIKKEANGGDKVKKTLRYAFIAIIIATLLFIWGQSCMSPTASKNESDTVKMLLEELFGAETPMAVFILLYIRKIAHFTEFAMLALEMTLFTYLCTPRRGSDLLRCVLFGPLTAITDETIQIFSGRGSSIFDVAIDTTGYLFSFLLTSLCYAIAYAVIKSISKRRKYGNV